MALAERVPQGNTLFPCPNCEPQTFQTTVELQTDELELLSTTYSSLIPCYTSVHREYNRAQQLASNSRRGCLFHSRKEWNPPGQVLSERERELLCGPSNSVKTQKRVVVEDIQTGRGIEYRAADSEGLLSCSSVVNVKLPGGNQHPLVGHIICLFIHSFVGHTRTFAKVAIYDHITEDCDSHLLFVPDMTATQLSKPLTTAKTDSELWILDL